MTNRRDKNVKGAAVISGYRMEPDLAQRLTAYARQNFTDERGLADIARATRFVMRSQLGMMEPDDHGLMPELTRGLRMEKYLFDSIEKFQYREELTGFVAAARHLLRLGLGIDAGESKRREHVFAELAAGKQGLMV